MFTTVSQPCCIFFKYFNFTCATINMNNCNIEIFILQIYGFFFLQSLGVMCLLPFILLQVAPQIVVFFFQNVVNIIASSIFFSNFRATFVSISMYTNKMYNFQVSFDKKLGSPPFFRIQVLLLHTLNFSLHVSSKMLRGRSDKSFRPGAPSNAFHPLANGKALLLFQPVRRAAA